MSYVSRDPFAREELHRQRVYCNSLPPTATSTGYGTVKTCDWCGQVPHTPTGRNYLFAYWIETDGGTKKDIKGMFCSVDCMRTHAH